MSKFDDLKRAESIENVKKADIPRLDALIYRPILEGKSLIERIDNEEDITKALIELKVIGEKEARTRLEPKGSGKNLRLLEEVSGPFVFLSDYE